MHLSEFERTEGQRSGAVSKRSHNLLARSQACFLPQFLSHPVPARFGVPVRDGLVRGNFPKDGSESGEGRRGCLEEKIVSSVGSQSFRIRCTRICRLGP